MIYHCKIQVRFIISNHLQKFGQVMAFLFYLVFVLGVNYKEEYCFPSITFEKMH